MYKVAQSKALLVGRAFLKLITSICVGPRDLP
jgi:hypothetical protein